MILADPTRIYECAGCHRRTYPEKLWRSMSPEERRNSGGTGGRGLYCNACEKNPEGRDPEPGADFDAPTCSDCGREVITHGQWKRASADERAELLQEGYVRVRKGTQCWDCLPAKRSQVPSTLSDEEVRKRKAQRGLTVAQYLEHRAAGITDRNEIARSIGISVSGLRKALRKARDNGQEIP